MYIHIWVFYAHFILFLLCCVIYFSLLMRHIQSCLNQSSILSASDVCECCIVSYRNPFCLMAIRCPFDVKYFWCEWPITYRDIPVVCACWRSPNRVICPYLWNVHLEGRLKQGCGGNTYLSMVCTLRGSSNTMGPGTYSFGLCIETLKRSPKS